MSWDYVPTPGPLTTSAMALFGNTSFFSAIQGATESNYTEVLRSICSGRVPIPQSIDSIVGSWSSVSTASSCTFIGSGFDRDPDFYLAGLVSRFIRVFADPKATKAVLETAMFAANEALLATTARQGWEMYSRSIYSSAGYEIHKPVESVVALVVVSVLLFVQVAGVVALGVYNASFPTWTTTLNALAMAKIGGDLKNAGLKPLGVRDKDWLDRLAAMEPEGVIGAVERDADSDVGGKVPASVLGLGAPGAITRATGKPESSKV